MFCYKCGTQLPDDAIFCAGCGAAQQGSHQVGVSPGRGYGASGADYQPTEQTYAPPGHVYTAPGDYYARQPEAPVQPSDTYAQSSAGGGAATGKKGKLWLKIAIPVFVIALAAAGIYYFVFLRNPANTVVRALANTGAEITQRIDGTPLKAFGLLSDILKDGTLTVDFDRGNERYGTQTTGSIKLSSISEEREFALAGKIKLYNDYNDEYRDVEFEAFINKERLAIGSRLFNDNFYGVRYSTFNDDIEVFGDAVGLDSDTMDQMTDVVNILDEMMNYSASDSSLNERFSDLLIKFYEGCEQTSDRVDIDIGGKSIRVTQQIITISKDAILGLLEGYYDLFEDNDDSRAIMDLYTSIIGADQYYSDGMSYNNALREFRSFIRDFEKYYSDASTITITLYIGSNDRLILAEIDASMRIDNERYRFSISFDFGESAEDRWVFKANADGGMIKVVWDYKERSSSLENTIVITTDEDTITLISDWAPGRGDFTLSFEDEDTYGWQNTGEITGVFREENNGFSLSFDNLMDTYYGDIFTIDITAEKGAGIKQIDYINIDRWDKALIEEFGDFINNSME